MALDAREYSNFTFWPPYPQVNTVCDERGKYLYVNKEFAVKTVKSKFLSYKPCTDNVIVKQR